MVKVNIPQLECKRCGHVWTPKQEEVRQCPKCKSAYFDREPKPKKDATK
jgi:predicted  nucleic acid-binding Zn-ribbon protein